MKKKFFSMHRRNQMIGTAFFAPWLIGFVLLTLYPLVYSLVISFSDVRIKVTGTELTPVGFTHYMYALTKDAAFPTALLDSLFLIVTGLPVVLVFSLVIALMLNKQFVGRGFFRAVFFLPVIILSGPVLTQLVEETDAMQLQMNFGILRDYMLELGGSVAPFQTFLDNLLRTMWFSGVQILILLASLQKIDTSMYEVASIDGATAWEMFWRITLPYLRPTILLCGIYTIVEMASISNDPTNIKIMSHLLEVNRPYSYSASMAWVYALAQLILIGITALLLMPKKGGRSK